MRVAVLLSGGVDSSVALHLLKKNNFAVTAFYIKVWLQDEFTALGDCPWEQDLDFARKVCQQLGVPLEVISLQKEYWQEVVEQSIGEIKSGLTPNPDFMCNTKIKFGKMLEIISDRASNRNDSENKISTNRFDFIASGHYAKVQHRGGESFLQESKDSFKDQTYFLAGLKKEQLKRIIFPLGGLSGLGGLAGASKSSNDLGGYLKGEVRALAEKFNLANFDRKDSQGVCFLGKIKFRDFIKYHLGEKKGKIIEASSGKILGEHQGYWYYTIGQRQGLSLGNGPWYVVKKDIHSNEVFVEREFAPGLGQPGLEKTKEHLLIDEINLLKEVDFSKKIEVKVRHGERKHQGEIKIIEKENPYLNKHTKLLEVILDKEKQGTALGQYAVLYQEGFCVLSGKIKEVFYSDPSSNFHSR